MTIIPIKEFAPAKLNLALHVVGQRSDGYHLLDMLIGFADIGDEITLSAEVRENEFDKITLEVVGAYADKIPQNNDNLIHHAIEGFLAHYKDKIAANYNYHVVLNKTLPVASGIGGGSADAAATLRAMTRFHNIDDAAGLMTIAQNLGADCPMCLLGKSCRASGIGDVLTPISMPKMFLVLVNPNQPISTPEIFKHLTVKDNAPLNKMPQNFEPQALVNFLKAARNDLTAPALEIFPDLALTLRELNKFHDADHVAMSGSGATCFALFKDKKSAAECAKSIQQQYPNWWTMAGQLL